MNRRSETGSRPAPGYREDLAWIHDAGFAGFARRAAPGILARLRAAGIRGGLVVDLGCGSGVWAATLCRAGYEVLGIDQSRAMIALARRRAPRARFLRGSFLRAAIPPCAAVTSMGECLNYLFDRRGGAGGPAALFARVHAALAPGGIFLLDFAEPGRGGGPGPSRAFRTGRGWAVLVEVEEDAARALLTRRITTFRKVGGSWRRRVEVHRLRLLPRARVAAWLREAGFRVRHIPGYGAQGLPPGQAAIEARRAPARGAEQVSG